MVQSPSWAADWLAASQEIPRISRNPKVHHRTHKRTSTLLKWTRILNILPKYGLKVKVTLEQVTKTQRGSTGIAVHFLQIRW